MDKRISSYLKNVATLRRCQLARDNENPPEDDDSECPICGKEVEQHNDGWRCTSCDWSAYPDYPEKDNDD